MIAAPPFLFSPPCCSWPPARPTPTGRPCARSPSTPPTSAMHSANSCRRTNTSSSSWWSADARIGSRRRAAKRVQLRRAGRLRAFRGQRVLLLQAAEQRDAAGRRDGARRVQRHLPRPLLAACRRSISSAATRSSPSPCCCATPEIVRGLVRAGQPRADAERFARALSERHAENARDRMRRVFPNVPVIYGFSSLAPYGRMAGPMLQGLLPLGRHRGGRQRACQLEAGEALRAEQHGGHERPARCGRQRRLSRTSLPVLRRPRDASGQAARHAPRAGGRHGAGAHCVRSRGEVLRGRGHRRADATRCLPARSPRCKSIVRRATAMSP